MNPFRAYFPRDDAPVSDGDGGWLGVDMRRHPGQLESGLAADATNLRFTDGEAAPRKGLRLLSWGARAEAGYGPGDILPYGTVAGAGVFNDPITGYSWLIIATTSGVFRTRPGTTGTRMTLPVGETIPSRVQIIQTFNGLVMLRGSTHDPIYCDDLNVGWKTLPAISTPGKVAIPRSSNGVYFQNRLFVIYEGSDSGCRDCIWVSDFGATTDALQGSLAYNGFKINQGSRDSLVALYRFNDTTLLAFKEESVYFVSNIYGTNEDIAANARLDAVTTEYGIKSPRSVVQVGNDVWFLAHKRGVCSIQQTSQNKLQGVDVPVSRDIDPLIRRISWEHATHAAATFWDNKVYVAVPLDGARTNASVLVFDTLTQRWAGRDESATLKVREWVRFEYGGVIRSAFVSDDGYLVLYEDGPFDHVGQPLGKVQYHSIATRLLTRGYLGSVSGRKRFTEARVTLRTWWPRWSVVAHVDGVSESRTIEASKTRSRTQYDRPHNATDWVPSNVNDDHARKFREDYSLVVPPEGLSAGENGLQASLHQELERAYRLRETGSHVQIEITSNQGRTVVRGVKVDTIRGETRMATQV